MASPDLNERIQTAKALVEAVHYLDGFEMLLATLYTDRFDGSSLIHPQCRKECEDTIWKLLSRFSTHEFNTIVLRFGLLNNRIVTLSEAARVLDLSEERVRQIEMQALRKLSQSSCRKQLDVFLEPIRKTSLASHCSLM